MFMKLHVILSDLDLDTWNFLEGGSHFWSFRHVIHAAEYPTRTSMILIPNKLQIYQA